MSVEERVKGIVAEQLSIGADEIKNESSFIDDSSFSIFHHS